MPAFLSKNYFCVQCKTGYDHISKHRCNNHCVYCHHIHEDGIEKWMHCTHCNRNFRSSVCFDKHKQSTKSGNSTCSTHYKCKTCNQFINTKLHKKEHRCDESYCKTCKDFFESGHKFYMLPVTPKDDKSNTYYNICDRNDVYIYFDFESTQDDVYQCYSGYFPGEWEPRRRDYLGEMTDELSDKIGQITITTFIGTGPKNYAYKLALSDKRGHSTKSVVKGITLNYKNSLDINFDTVKDMVTGEKKESVAILNNIICRDINSTNIVTKAERKEYKIVFDTRVIRENYKTEPYGM